MMNYKSCKKILDKKGYAIIRDFLNESETKKIKNQLIVGYKKYLDKSINEKNIHEIITWYEHNNKHDELYFAFKKICKSNIFNSLSKKLSLLCNSILKNKTRLINTGIAIGISGSKRTAYEWHQEKPYYINTNTIHFQFPILSPLNKKNGTMSVLSGSHEVGYIKNIINKRLSKKSVYSYIPKNIKKMQTQYPEKYFNMGLRDVAIFDENLIHKSNKNLSKKIRFAGIIRLEIVG